MAHYKPSSSSSSVQKLVQEKMKHLFFDIPSFHEHIKRGADGDVAPGSQLIYRPISISIKRPKNIN